MRRSVATVVLALAAAIASAAAVQRRGVWEEYAVEPRLHNVPYDGRFTFARIKYTTAPGGYWYQGMPSWAHGYPMSEDNLMRIMNEVTLLRGRDRRLQRAGARRSGAVQVSDRLHHRGRLVDADRPRGSRRCAPTSQKGGFVIVDDFKTPSFYGGGGWDPFEANMRRVLPGARVSRHAGVASDLPFVLRDQLARQFSAGLQRRRSGLPRRVRGQRPHASGC